MEDAMKKFFMFAFFVVVLFVGGCSEQLKQTDEFSISLPWTWVEVKGMYEAMNSKAGAWSPDRQVFSPSAWAFESPQSLNKILRWNYARVVIDHYKIIESNFLIRGIDNFNQALNKGIDILEKGEVELGGKRSLWCVQRVEIPVNSQRETNPLGTREVVNTMSVLWLNYLVEKNEGEFYRISFQTKEKDFPAQRPLFEKMAQTFQLK
jgi:hypothetical protein